MTKFNPELDGTRVAKLGHQLTLRFLDAFETDDVAGHRAVLRSPEVSTGGGKQARQHIALQPRQAGGLVITVGWVNGATNQSLIRTHECLAMVHAQRGRSLPVDRLRYQAFFERLRAFLQSEGMQIEVESQPPELAGTGPARAGAGGSLLWVWALVATAAALGLAAYVLL